MIACTTVLILTGASVVIVGPIGKEVSEIVYKNEVGETIVLENLEGIVSIKLEDLMLAVDVDMVVAKTLKDSI